MADIPPGNVAVAVRPRRDRFFIVMTGLMLVIVLVGFAHTLYLRVLFDLPEIPAQLYVHGTVLTIWFSLAFVQTWLIATDRTAIHRRLGVAGMIVAVGVVVVPLSGETGSGHPAGTRSGTRARSRSGARSRAAG